MVCIYILHLSWAKWYVAFTYICVCWYLSFILPVYIKETCFPRNTLLWTNIFSLRYLKVLQILVAWKLLIELKSLYSNFWSMMLCSSIRDVASVFKWKYVINSKGSGLESLAFSHPLACFLAISLLIKSLIKRKAEHKKRGKIQMV